MRLSKWPAFVVLICATSLSIRLRGQSQANDAASLAVKMLYQQIGLDRTAPNAKNPNGLRIQFVKIADVDLPDGKFARYRLLVPGAPANEDFVLGVWRIGQQVRASNEHLHVNAKGLVMHHAPSPEEMDKESLDRSGEYEVDLQAANGEPVRYMLSSANGTFFFPGTIVLHPIEAEDKNCRLEARLGFPEAQGVLVYADGFPAAAEAALESSSEEESHPQALKIDEHGHGSAIILPNVAGKESGTLKLTASAAGCAVHLEMPWGKGSYKRY